MKAFARALSLFLLAGSVALAGPPAVPVPTAESETPCFQLHIPACLQAIIDCVRSLLPRESAPYLHVTNPSPMRLAGPDYLQRQPPPLPSIVLVEPKTGNPAGANPAPGSDPAGILAPTLPTSPVPPPPTPEEEAIKFFEHEDPGIKPGSEKHLGPAFDPTFAPGVPPPTSSATYRIVP